MNEPKKPGRKPAQPGTHKSARLDARLTPKQAQTWAQLGGAKWLRERLDEEAGWLELRQCLIRANG